MLLKRLFQQSRECCRPHLCCRADCFAGPAMACLHSQPALLISLRKPMPPAAGASLQVSLVSLTTRPKLRLLLACSITLAFLQCRGMLLMFSGSTGRAQHAALLLAACLQGRVLPLTSCNIHSAAADQQSDAASCCLPAVLGRHCGSIPTEGGHPAAAVALPDRALQAQARHLPLLESGVR